MNKDNFLKNIKQRLNDKKYVVKHFIKIILMMKTLSLKLLHLI